MPYSFAIVGIFFHCCSGCERTILMPDALLQTYFLSSTDMKRCGSVLQPTDMKSGFLTEIKSGPMRRNHTVEFLITILF